MGILYKILTSIVLLSYIILVPAPVMATVPVSSTIHGQNRSVYISLHYDDADKGMAVIKARLEQDIHALEHVFQSLQESGELDNRYSILFIRVGYSPDTESSFAPAVTTLSRTSATALVSGFPMEGPLWIYHAQNLGRAYMIDTTTNLASFTDLLALVLLLPRLNEQNPVLTVSDKEPLTQIKNSQEYQAFSNLRLELRPFRTWSSEEGQELVAVWQAGVFSYSAHNILGDKLFELQPLDYYLTKPSWSPRPISRFLAYATERELYFVETLSRKTHRIDLTDLFPLRYLQMSESIELAFSPQGEYIYFTLSFNLPEEFWETENHTYVFALDTGEVRVARAEAPGAAEPATESSQGRVADLVTPLPGYVSPVYQLIGRGWRPGRVSRYESFVSPHWAALLPEDKAFVFHPAELLWQSRFLAYGSQEEIVVYNIIEQKYHHLNLKELNPADYQKISKIRFAQNQTGDKIYFSLEGYSLVTTAFIWDIFTDTLEQSGKTLEEMQMEGWAEFAPGDMNYLLPPNNMILTGNEARRAISRYRLSLPTGAFVSLSAWLGVLFFAFGLPFVLSNAAVSLATLKLKSTRVFFALGPALTTVLFVALSILTIRFTLPYGDVIKGRVYPLPWFYHVSSTAGMTIMWGFVVAVLAALTILVFYQACILPRTFSRDSARFQQEGKSVAVTRIIATLVHVFLPTVQQNLPPATPPATAVPASALAANKFKFPIGLLFTSASALFVLIFLTIERAGWSSPPYLALLMLLSLFYLAVSSVFYLARLLTVRLAGLLFTPERIKELTSKP